MALHFLFPVRPLPLLVAARYWQTALLISHYRSAAIAIGGWPGLKPELLDGPGDLPVWNNYRNVLAPVLQRHGAQPASLAKIFPDFALSPLALY